MEKESIHKTMRRELAAKTIFEQAKAHALDYMDGIADRPVFPAAEDLERLACFDEALGESPQPADAVLSQLHDCGSPATVAQNGGRYFGFVNGGIVPAALAARWLADTWDQNAALHAMSPVAAKLEEVCQRWLADLLGLPRDTVAGFVGGTSMATLCGLAAARHVLLERRGWDVNADGLFGAPPIRVVASEQAHGTVFKALALLGLGRQRIELLAADAQGRLTGAGMPRLDDATLLILQAGNVNTGAFDAFDEICEQANAADAWVHVDGAFGLWAAASAEKRHLTAGMEKADSWSVDGHKTLNTPYDCGIVLCRHPRALVAAMQASGAYIHFSEQRDGMLYSPDMSRRARAVELWATLKYLGRRGVAQLVDGLCRNARLFADQLAQHGFRILNDVVFNQVLVACRTPWQTEATLRGVQASGVCWCGATEWNGEPAIRISVCSWATTPQDVQRCVEAFAAALETPQHCRPPS